MPPPMRIHTQKTRSPHFHITTRTFTPSLSHPHPSMEPVFREHGVGGGVASSPSVTRNKQGQKLHTFQILTASRWRERGPEVGLDPRRGLL
ncbi:hypothetical protein JZ751_003212 [Albula glossodonta]|uniref:Uncharacterized protein n=1 Tax=Albula glossodonta TaxID=121402 RepID=A0A8T2NA94_9TELE|nr:hypothetical protein JZ751_003212 [Albula glossodonta]